MQKTKTICSLIVLLIIGFSPRTHSQDCSTLIQEAPTHTIYFSKNSSSGEVGIYGTDANGNLLGDCSFTLGAYSYPSFSFFNYDLYAAGTAGFTAGVLDEDNYGMELLDENISSLGTTFTESYSIEATNGGLLYNQGGELFFHNPFESDTVLADFTFDIKGIAGYASESDDTAFIFVTTGDQIYKIAYNPTIGLPSLSQTLVYTGVNLGAIEWVNTKLYVVENVNTLKRIDDDGNNPTLVYTHNGGLVSSILDLAISKEDETLFFSTITQYTFSGSTWDIAIKKLNASDNIIDIVTKNQDSPNYNYESFNGIEVNLSNPSSLGVSTVSNSNLHKLSPNPTTSSLSIQGVLKDERYRIYSIQGQLIQQGKMSNQEISVKDLTPGVYLIQMDKRPTLKFIKL